ncbi:dihydropteroate synthase [Gramella sp. AN32]|uniref:dihydropteroate synthase n=1 Tax=Christiangramia antarctica TaxID=2058158 RepID=A0ABW5X6M8_9FLAO|nr:dihydropteroate synthase [Gramella sp. AN32]MCM4154773.1 dihydropteroate synthase [Gramella sp. AN32]
MFLNCKGNLIDLSTPKVMGILNITPDSFYAESRKVSEKSILDTAEKMLTEGADFLDIGGYSSRPGAKDISEEEELQRVLPAIRSILSEFPEALISIDTFRSKIAEASVNYGASIINDISAGKLDERMLNTVAKLQVPYVMMHMKGSPQNMKELNQYEDLLKEIIFYFSERINTARKLGISDIILDPGFGFAKNMQQNFELLSKFELLNNLNLPVLAGVSRKSMIWKTLKVEPSEALNGSTSLNTVALLKGAKILRVHDVKEAKECIKLTGELTN